MLARLEDVDAVKGGQQLIGTPQSFKYLQSFYNLSADVLQHFPGMESKGWSSCKHAAENMKW